MTKVSDLEYLRFNKWKRFGYRFVLFFVSIPSFFLSLFKKIGLFFKNLGLGIAHYFRDLVLTFIHGSWKTKVSYFIMGFGSCARKQWLRGILFFLMEVVFIIFMVLVGSHYLGKLGSLGTLGRTEVYDPIRDVNVYQYHDNSFKILLYSVLSIFFIIAFIYTWSLNIKQNRINDEIEKDKKKMATDKDDLRSVVDENFHRTLLTLPSLGIIIFTILPIVFMILIAFTSYDVDHDGYVNLFHWVGFKNFNKLFTWTSGGASFSATFGEILVWTLIWAFFATFTNYFLGMLVAMLINRKGIKLKKVWRTVLVLSIAIPQFISLLFVSKMFSEGGIINGILSKLSGHVVTLPFWTDPIWAKFTVIIINIWIGIPYLMLITTGILMNVPQDLYESAKIDGANVWQQYVKITLPYMLFVTGPYLLTSFTANMNNFNVIYLLTGGGPSSNSLYGSAGKTDLLITWLYSLTVNDSSYNLASVIGIMVFAVVAIISLIVYNLIPSTKNEEDFQ
ncbi:MAG: sugar ABC transporter permease [Bacilli bacterium]|nr:sugar ABC transporter permease [Bacilli bacterium]